MHPLSLLWNQTQDMTLHFLRSLWLIAGYTTKSQVVPSMPPEQPWSPIPGYSADLQLTSYIMLHRWFMVMKLQGLFAPVSPSKMWQPARVDNSTRAMKSRPNQKPPEIILLHTTSALHCLLHDSLSNNTQSEGRKYGDASNWHILPLTFISVALLE